MNFTSLPSSALPETERVPKVRGRSIAAALKDAYRKHGGDKFTKQATKRFLR